mgnify:CR=1 FL=1
MSFEGCSSWIIKNWTSAISPADFETILHALTFNLYFAAISRFKRKVFEPARQFEYEICPFYEVKGNFSRHIPMYKN